MRCNKCQKFGHSAKKCFNKEVCCGIVGEHEKCEDFPCFGCNNLTDDNVENHMKCIGFKCVNCSGAHKSSDRRCPEYLKEYEISKIKCEERVSHFQAKKIYGERNKAPIMNFAGAMHSQSLEQMESQSRIDNAIAALSQKLEDEIKKNNERDMQMERMRKEHAEQMKGLKNLLKEKDKLKNIIKSMENKKNSFESILGIDQKDQSGAGNLSESEDDDTSIEIPMTPSNYIDNFANKNFVIDESTEDTSQRNRIALNLEGMDQEYDQPLSGQVSEN